MTGNSGDDPRDILTEGQSLSLYLESYKDNQKQVSKTAETFEIRSCCGIGGSCVCYEVFNRHSRKMGRLKEFYPLESCQEEPVDTFHRNDDGALVPCHTYVSELASGWYQEKAADFLKAYDTLQEIQSDRNYEKTSRLLNNFIPTWNIYVSKCQVYYIWTQNDIAGESFDRVLAGCIDQCPENSVASLRLILNVMIELCIKVHALHTLALLHLDLKPSNFMVAYDGNGLLNPSQLSLFDINSLYDMGNRQEIGRAHV